MDNHTLPFVMMHSRNTQEEDHSGTVFNKLKRYLKKKAGRQTNTT